MAPYVGLNFKMVASAEFLALNLFGISIWSSYLCAPFCFIFDLIVNELWTFLGTRILLWMQKPSGSVGMNYGYSCCVFEFVGSLII